MSNRVTTREFVMSDYDDVIALWEGVEGVEICEGDSRQEIAEYLNRNPGLSRVAILDDKLVGAALCGHDGRRGWIYHLAVATSHRRQKVGQLLVESCEKGLRAAGLRRAIILVAGDKPDGRDFWLRNGWEIIDGAIAMTREL